MIECMIVGDSIAVGVSQARKECVRYAHSGWNSQRWNKHYLTKAAAQQVGTVIISLGANDHSGVKTEQELRRMRQQLQSHRVFWIGAGADRKPQAQAAIEKIASEYGDTVIARPKEHMSADGVHPTGQGYKILGQQTQ